MRVIAFATLLAATLGAYVMSFAYRKKIPARGRAQSWGVIGRGFLKSGWAISTPLLLIVGIRTGVFTVTELGAVLVIYDGAEYGEIADTEYVAQLRTMRFGIGVIIRDLGWAYGGPSSGMSPGAYQVIEAIRISLTGFRPIKGCEKMYPVSEDFHEIDKEGGTFTYSTTFVTKVMAVENHVEPNFPLLVKAVAQEKGGGIGDFGG